MPSTKALGEIEVAINNSGHRPFLDSFVTYVLKQKEAKKNCLWLHGAPNSGKTKLLERFSEIFYVV